MNTNPARRAALAAAIVIAVLIGAAPIGAVTSPSPEPAAADPVTCTSSSAPATPYLLGAAPAGMAWTSLTLTATLGTQTLIPNPAPGSYVHPAGGTITGAVKCYKAAPAATTTTTTTIPVQPPAPVTPPKVRICHATASNTNPYVSITVDQDAVDGDLGNDRGRGDHYMEHLGPIGPTADGKWGDIIPAIAGVHEGRNWTAAGQDIWYNACAGEDPAAAVWDQPAQWCWDGGVKNVGVATPYVVPAPPSGKMWTQLIIKSGIGVGANQSHANPQPGEEYRHTGGRAITHAILCYAPKSGTSSTANDYKITMVARVCDDYTDIFANRSRNNIMESLKDLGPNTPYSTFTQVQPSIEDGEAPQTNCRPLPDWTFTFGSGIARPVPGTNLSYVTGASSLNRKVTTQASTPLLDSAGKATNSRINGATTFTLTKNEASLASKSSKLWVQGGTTTEPLNDDDDLSFGALRCATDNLNGDNVEWVGYPSGGRHVFCFAYYVDEPPAPGKITIKARTTTNATQKFTYGGDVSYNPGGVFDLTVNNGNSAQTTFDRAADTTWTVTQSPVNGWRLDSLECTSAGDSTWTRTVSNAEAKITLAEADNVTCTFTNAPSSAPVPSTTSTTSTTVAPPVTTPPADTDDPTEPPTYTVQCANTDDTAAGLIDWNDNDNADAEDTNIIVPGEFPGCYGYTNTGQIRECSTSFEVWRFYGTVGNPAQVRTASRVSLPASRCTQDGVLITPFHPEDDPTMTAEFGAWRARYELDRAEGPTSVIDAAGTKTYTPLKPFRRDGDCTAFAQPDTYLPRLFVGGDLYNTPEGAQARSEFAAMWTQHAAKVGPALANQMMNVATGNGATGEVTFGDTARCGSPMDFTVNATSADAARDPELFVDRRVVAGVCWLPVTRTSESWARGSSTWWTQRLNAYTNGSDEKYDLEDTYATPNQPTGGSARQNAVLTTAFQAWRSSVADEIATRPLAGEPGAPAQVTANTGGLPPGGRDTGAAANAHCSAGFGHVTVDDNSANVAPPAIETITGAELNTTVPDVGAAGQRAHEPSDISTSSGAILCGELPCEVHQGVGPYLDGYDPTFAVDGDAGQRVTNAYDGNANGSGRIRYDFTKPTPPQRDLHVDVAGDANVYVITQPSRTSQVCYVPLMGTNCTSTTITPELRAEARVPIVPRYTNGQTFPVVNITASPTSGR